MFAPCNSVDAQTAIVVFAVQLAALLLAGCFLGTFNGFIDRLCCLHAGASIMAIIIGFFVVIVV